jgi:hypothetical protein
MQIHEDKDDHGFLNLTGRLSGKTIRIPDVNAPPMPYIVAPASSTTATRWRGLEASARRRTAIQTR